MSLTEKIMLGLGKPRMPLDGWEKTEELILAARNRKLSEESIEDVRERVKIVSDSDSVIVDEEALQMAS